MGIYDRQYYREEEQPRGIHLGGTQSMIMTLIIINAAFFLANMFFGGQENWITNLMTAKSDTLVTPWRWWEFLSYGFAHSPNLRDFHLIGNMFVLWMFGRAVEPIYGRWEFLRFYLTAIVLGGIFWSAHMYLTEVPLPNKPLHTLLGASGGVTAVLILFIFHYPKQMVLMFFVIPMPAWVLGLFIIGNDILTIFKSGSIIAADVHLVGAAFAICYFKFHWNIGRMLPGGGSTSWLKKLSQSRRRSTFRIHDPDADSRHQKSDDNADRILDKLHREGEQSLTRKERKILENYSRRMRQKRQ